MTGSLPDGQWIVVNRDGQRWEFPIAPAPADDAAVREAIAAELAAIPWEAVWQVAVSQSDMMVSPAKMFGQLVVDSITDPTAAARLTQ